ncbi:MAG: copper homeostasis protein CutC [Flavobacteriia bacterium]|jgi:copper homeostasis protein
MKIELCVASIEAIDLAGKFEFDRIELCQVLEIGGLTPSIAMQKIAFKKFPNVHVLIRCRQGNFVYSSDEKELMLHDVGESVNLGASGVVIGSLLADFSLDIEFIKTIRQKYPTLELTFHRAFDDLVNPLESLEQLIDLGVTRVLTSGGKANVVEGIQQIQECISRASGRIEIMIGGGINENNISGILAQIEPDAVHFSGTISNDKKSNSLFEEKLLQVDEQKVKNILKKIR